MRPSELKACGERPAPRKLKFPVDEKADPPISLEEALAATHALCPSHGGIFGQRGEKHGDVYLCLHPTCHMYRRYTKRAAPSRYRIKYEPRGQP